MQLFVPQSYFIDAYAKAKIIGQMTGKIHICTVTYLQRYHLLYGEMPFSSSCTSVSLAAGATARQFIKVNVIAEKCQSLSFLLLREVV